MATEQHPFSDSSSLSALLGSEVESGVLKTIDIDLGTVLSFDGSSTTAKNSTVNYRSGDTSGTITAWVKTDNTGTMRVLCSSDEATSDHRLMLTVFDSGRLAMVSIISGALDYVQTDSQKLADSRWHHIACISSGTAWNLYIDGEEEAISVGGGTNSGEWFGDISNRDNVTIGYLNQNTSSGYWDGNICNVRVYSSTLTAAQLHQLATTGEDPDSGNLVGHWPCDTGSGSTENDEAGSANMTLANHTWSTTHRKIFTSRSRTTSNDLVTAAASSVDNWLWTPTGRMGGVATRAAFSSDGTTWNNHNNTACDNSGCYEFDGNDYFERTITDYHGSDSAGSVAFWFKTNSTTAGYVFSSSDEGTTTSYVRIYISSTGQVVVQQRDGGGDTPSSIASGQSGFNDGRWHHAGVISSGTAYTIYVDGVDTGITNLGGSNDGDWFADVSSVTRDNITLGVIHNTSYTSHFNGFLDDVRVFSSALSSTEVWDLYADNETPANQVSWWELDDNGNDSQGSDTLTITGAISITDWHRCPPFGTLIGDASTNPFAVLDFDGSNDEVDVGNIGSINSVQFWMKPHDVTSRKIIDIDGTDQIEINGSSNIVATSFPAATVYVNGETDTITLEAGEWYHVCVVDSTGVNASTFAIGSVGASYFDGVIANVATYTSTLSAATVQSDYENGYPSSTNRQNLWYLNEGTGTTATDDQGSDNGTITGATWIKADDRPLADTGQDTIDLSALSLTDALYVRLFHEGQGHGNGKFAHDEWTADYTATATGALQQTLLGVGV